ncbi:UPF0182 family protein [Nocardioides daejeonensis]|uniref:UPF0182 family membrane protein n=1 Tax=Nocardioides daejeonensis TaxID=1046556 RepID=UPI000D74A2C3|nr:UPF0182 family protein [Nocardioides daejeonensis]
MSNLFDDEPERPVRNAPPPRRPRALWITLAIMVALFLAFTGVTALYTERLWFGSVGYETVFSTLLRTRIGLFLIFGLVMAAVVAINLVLAFRFRPLFRPASPEQINLDRYRQAITPIRVWLTIGISLVIGAFAGTTASGKWRDYQLWRHGSDFGAKDPYFKRDIGFYVFDLPWYHFIVDFTMAMLLVSLIAAALVHYVFGGIKLQSRGDRLSGAAAAQLSVLLGLFVLAKAADYWLDRFDLLNGSGGLHSGMGYTDDHAVLPAKNILMFIAIICAVLFFANVVRRTWLLPGVGLSLLVLSSILLGMIWPAIVQQFQVDPSQASKEEPYLQKNIDATRAAYDIEDPVIEEYAGDTALSKDEQRAEVSNAAGIRLVDPAVVRATFEQRQQVTGYYTVPDVLDVGRYEINGQQRDVVIGVRELNQDGLPDGSKNWSNLHTVYTHGYGVIAAYGNQQDADGNDAGGSDNLAWAEQKLPPEGDLTNIFSPNGYRGQIYFGEKSPEYSIVGKAKESDRDVELDLPNDVETDSSKTTTYDGKAGVDVGSTWRQLMYAWKFGEPSIVLSNRVNENSKILYDRNPRQMVEKVAPWLTVDSDPFPAVVDGKIVWILDGFTTTDQYPQAQRDSFETMTDDALSTSNEFKTLPTDEINYIRNAVKAVVDAYDGSVTLYAWDESDPLLKAWRAAFPGTVKDKSEIPADLLTHMRYPEDMFKVQRYQLASYHVDDAKDFYEGNARWEVPEDPSGKGVYQPPYRLSVRTPSGGADPIYSLTSVYVPYKKQNLAAFISVDADASQADYGTFRVLQLPGTSQVDGPGQMANKFNTNEVIQTKLEPLTRNDNQRVIKGNLLTLPVGEGLLYVQPIYTVQRSVSSANFPVLKYVTVAFGGKYAIGETVAEAVANVLSLDEGESASTDDPDAGEPSTGENPETGEPLKGSVAKQIRSLLEQADEKFTAANKALQEGDLGGYADRTKEAEDLVSKALELATKKK